MQDGRPLVTGTIRAEDQQADIAGSERPMTGKVPLTPAQQRALDEDRWPDDPSAPPGYEAGTAIVTDPNQPRRPRADEAQPLDAWERIDGDEAAESSEAKSTADVRQVQQQAQKLRENFRAHLGKVKANCESAIRSGRGDAAVSEVEKTLTLAAELKRNGVL